MVEQTRGLALAPYMDKEVLAPLSMKSNSYALSPGFEPAAGVDHLGRDDEPQVGLSTGHDTARHRASPPAGPGFCRVLAQHPFWAA
ncbi:hypothetical protein [Nonomuraea jabiensis]|uniref:CubicO group peptidase (Beta-lactamase class C family) n=1 Tax=Nonomuraea jabiensis TaxID=882448 RepID=A0A7W9G8Y5_9ACTN|nr:hypothetical protein [Nonomuraea jabiensis]MBB5779316.1 CubicO group peptidase (beta-lactamase class C family) [Nonomuraea jabiensis]